MDLQTHFDVLSTVLEGYESGGRTVRRVETESIAGAGLRATMDVVVPLEAVVGDGAPAATLTDEGEVRLEVPDAGLPACPEDVAAAVTTTPQSARTTEEGALVVSVALAIDPGDEAAGTGGESDARGDGSGIPDPDPDEASEDPLAAVRDDSVPPYEDTEYLRALYDACDTFAEMSREIQMDVSSETVRRYMIEAGVHDPETYDGVSEESAPAGADDEEVSAGADDDGTDHDSGDGVEPSVEDPMEEIPDHQLVADGIGLPADLTLDDVADAVVGSATVYQVHRRLGIEQDRARELLRELNLLDLVLHRIGGPPVDEPTYEEVASRIRQCTPEGA